MNFEVSNMPSWVVEEWNGHESNHFYSLCQVAWDFFNKFSKQTLLSSSFVDTKIFLTCVKEGDDVKESLPI